jgi:CMP-N,N'-diacetyllegionaminic acid synthase
MEVLAIVPARSGSKGIKHKNLQLWRGRPLLEHAINHARGAKSINRVLVSTDSADYATLARTCGADVPFLRPAELAGDLSTDLQVFQHALAWLADRESYRPDICVHLRPTYPSRDPAMVDQLICLLIANQTLDSVRTVVAAVENPFKMWFRSAEGLLSPALTGERHESYNLPRQLLPLTYWQNGCVDVVRTSVILEQNSITGRSIYGYVMSPKERLDIDTSEDLERFTEEYAGLSDDLAGRSLTFCFDLDGVIAALVPDNNYSKATPIESSVHLVNRLFQGGHRIVIFTARGSLTGIDWTSITEAQLSAWGVKYHELRFGKPAADVYIDDKSSSLAALQRCLL